MSKSINKVIVLGNVGKEPILRETSTTIAGFTLATSERFKDKNSGEWQERTEWHNVTAFGKLAEIIQKFVHRGTQLYIEGRLQTRSWEDQKSGQTRYKTEIVASEIILLSARDETSSGGSYSSSGTTSHDPDPSAEITDGDIPF